MTMNILRSEVRHLIKLGRLVSGDGFVYGDRLYVVIARCTDRKGIRCFCFHSPIGEEILDENLEVTTTTINVEWSTTE